MATESCRKCKGLGYFNRAVMALGPILPLAGKIYEIAGRRNSYIPAKKSGTAFVSYDCHVCDGTGRVKSNRDENNK